MRQQIGLRLCGLIVVLMAALLVVILLPGPVVADDGGPAPEAAAAVTPGIDCSNPPTGRKVKMVGEDEIAITVRSNSNKALEFAKLDNSGQNLVWGGNWFGSGDMSDVRWPVVATGDLNGDGKQEAVMAFRDKQKRLGVATVGGPEWYADVANYKGDTVAWIDIATGNLDRSADGDDEVVVALSNNAKDMNVVLLDGDSAGNIRYRPNTDMGSYYGDTTLGRGDVKYVAVATGDLNGDSYDDEIVAAFKDGSGKLQVWIMRKVPGYFYLEMLYSRQWLPAGGAVAQGEYSYSPNMRPIDVTTGDVDGDKRDEVILAYPSGPHDVDGYLEMMVLDRAADSETYDDRVTVQRKMNEYAYDTAIGASVAAADFDGDGTDEIAVAYAEAVGDMYGVVGSQNNLVSYEWVPESSVEWEQCLDAALKPRPCLQQRPDFLVRWWGGRVFHSAADYSKARAALATGDLDADGKAEIALMVQDQTTGNGRVVVFDADDSIGYARTSFDITWSGADSIEEFWLDVGDMDGNSRYAAYTGACRQATEAQVTAVLHAPPYWPGKNDGSAEAGFGQSVTIGAGTGTTTESTLGGSLKLGWDAGVVTTSWTQEWEKAAAVGNTTTTETVEGSSFSTNGNPLHPDAIGLIETKQWCYDYVEVGAPTHTMSVCVPRPHPTLLTYPLDWWYTTGITTYADSWTPVGVNLAEDRIATQSSNNSGPTAGYAAVDGNTDGEMKHFSVTETGYEYAWWQVDLGSVQWVDGIQVWNRSDCCQNRLTDWYVFVSDVPFPTTDPGKLVDNGVWNRHYAAYPTPVQTVPVARTGRYVRVQLAGKNYLNLAEVQVWGRPGTPAAWPDDETRHRHQKPPTHLA